MKKNESTGRIRIIKTPEGEAPLEVREAWVDLILPCDPYCGFSDKEQGVRTGEILPNRQGYSVPQEEALAILTEKHSEAAQWFYDNGFPEEKGYFGFAMKEAVIVSGVVYQQLMCVDEMDGHPNR